MVKFVKKTSKSFIGEIEVAPDKSISHRSIIFASLANGITKIYNLLEGEDVLNTINAMKLMGVEITKKTDYYEVIGSGIAGLCEPNNIIDMGNSGTSSRLLAGLVCPYNFTSFFTGDHSLRKRPNGRVFEPIRQFGAQVIAKQNNFMPFAIIGNENAIPIEYVMKMASAQVKSCILLASLRVRGTTTIFEPEKCRDHTEIMMQYLGLKLSLQSWQSNSQQSGTKISYNGLQEFNAKDFFIPNDISSASFFIVACLLVKNSKIILKKIGINPLRTGLVTTLKEMGANIEYQNTREIGGELVADILVESSNLSAVDVPIHRSSSMIDEFPILAIACAFANGISRLNGLAELKVKESNRLKMIADNLKNCGVEVKIGDDYLEIKGGFAMPKNPVPIITAMDHRIAMSFSIMGLCLENGINLDDDEMIKTSFPNFEKILSQVL
ncbi:MAG: 3-phosphoshikimate 1-carboxyvinyltransferase [Alphaproteobacteria bacterium]